MYRMTTSNRLSLPSAAIAPRRWPRWLVAMAAVLVLHFVAGLWVIRASGPSWLDKQDFKVPVQVELLKPKAVRSMADEATSKDEAQAGSQAGDAGKPGAPARKDALQASLGEATPQVSHQVSPQVSHQISPQISHQAAPQAMPRATRQATPPSHKSAPPALRDTPHARVSKPVEPAQTVASAPSLPESSPQAPAADASSAAASSTSTNSLANSPASASANTAASPPTSESTSANASVTPGSLAHSNAGSATDSATNGEKAGPGIAAPAANAAQGEKFSLPPPADLHYDSFYNGVQNPSGTIHWATDGSTYQMIVSIPLPFVGTYSYISEGRVDAYGLAPLRYTEQHGRRGTDITTFTRDDANAKPHAVFSRNPANIDLPPGAQDRFSMFMQLSSLVRGDPARYTAGVTREFFVLDNDSGETWPIETVGDESVQTSLGFVPARHFTRLPRREGDRRKVDVWLAPSLGWLPIRFMQTEPNGTQIELRYAGSDTSRNDAHSTRGEALDPQRVNP
jgi:hypothetical protein